jgi:hypothetical protein
VKKPKSNQVFSTHVQIQKHIQARKKYCARVLIDCLIFRQCPHDENIHRGRLIGCLLQRPTDAKSGTSAARKSHSTVISRTYPAACIRQAEYIVPAQAYREAIFETPVD